MRLGVAPIVNGDEDPLVEEIEVMASLMMILMAQRHVVDDHPARRRR